MRSLPALSACMLRASLAWMDGLTQVDIYTLTQQGTFDDAQAIVKQSFQDKAFRDKVSLGAVNSINWARVLAQITYYFYAYFQVLKKGR